MSRESSNDISSRRQALFASTVAVLVAGLCSVATADPTRYVEMFLDDAKVHSSSGISRVLQQPDRMPNPVLTGAGSHDPRRSFGTVIFDESEKLYKAWYQINAESNSVAYATSVDGLSWNYPKLGLVSFPRNAEPTPANTSNNILFRGLGHRSMYNVSVIKDDADADPSRRYKMVYFDSTAATLNGVGGVFTGTSPDGIHWTRTSTPAAPQLTVKTGEDSIHDVVEMIYDSNAQKYVIYSKGYDRTGNRNNNRQIVRTESADFVNWSTPRPVLRHDHTLLDPQSYGASVFEYQGLQVMLLRIYHNTGLADGQRGDRTIDVQLAASRDGTNWTRVANKGTFMSLGSDGTWDDGMILPYRPFEKDGKVHIYYHGWNGPHENPGDGTPVSRVATVGLATLDAGRFVGIAASGASPGTLTTTTFVMDGDQLLLNAELGADGDIDVTLLQNGLPIQGYGGAQSVLTRLNDLFYSVSFSGMDLAALSGETLSLRFAVGGDAMLYGYTTSLEAAAVPEPMSLALLLPCAGWITSRYRRANPC